jgi:hypothetical protein
MMDLGAIIHSYGGPVLLEMPHIPNSPPLFAPDLRRKRLGATQLETTLHAVNRPGRTRTCSTGFGAHS